MTQQATDPVETYQAEMSRLMRELEAAINGNETQNEGVRIRARERYERGAAAAREAVDAALAAQAAQAEAAS